MITNSVGGVHEDRSHEMELGIMVGRPYHTVVLLSRCHISTLYMARTALRIIHSTTCKSGT